MKTRDEFIAETAREFDIHGRRLKDGTRQYYDAPEAIDSAKEFADLLEAEGVEPWPVEIEMDDETHEKVLGDLLTAVLVWAKHRCTANRRFMHERALDYARGVNRKS